MALGNILFWFKRNLIRKAFRGLKKSVIQMTQGSLKKQELKALLDPVLSIITTYLVIYDDKKSENSELCLIMALDLLLHCFVLHHFMPFWNYYLLFLSVSQCQGIAPCYAILEFTEFLEISLT